MILGRDRRTVMQRVGSWATAARDACGRALDGIVFTVSPAAGAERMLMRKIMEAGEKRLQRGSDDRGGNDKADRLDGPQRWMSSRLSPDSEMERDLETDRQRSAELYRTSTAGGAIDTKCDHVVGKGFTYRPKIKKQPGISSEAAMGFNTQLLEVYNRWSRRCDITGRDSLWEQSQVSQRSIDYAGETITIMWSKMRPGQPIPLILEVVDCERLSTPPSKSGDPFCRMGIQYADDRTGEIVGYWIRTTHPDDTKQVEFKWDMIPSDRVLHVFDKWFPAQSRGYPWMRRTLDRWRDGEDLDEAGIIAAQVEACHAAFVKTREPLKVAQAAGNMRSNGMRTEDIRPGKITYMDADSEEVLFSTPTKSNIVGTLHEWNHRRIAAGIDWPYEFLMKDWRGVSFAGGRLVLNGAKIKCGVAQEKFITKWLSWIADEFVKQCVLFQAVDINLSAFQQRPWVYQAHRWTPCAWSYAITPMEEINAKIAAVENNQRTLSSVVEENGDEMDEIFEERQIEVEKQESKGIVPAARLVAMGQLGKNGNAQETPSPQAKEASNGND